MMTLWCMFRSLLMIGAELTKMDDFTLSLLTNKELLVLLSEDFRGEQLRRYFFELFMKVGAAGKSSFFCNNIHSPVGSFKKLLCLINAHGCNVSTKSLQLPYHPLLLLKQLRISWQRMKTLFSVYEPISIPIYPILI